MFWLFDRKDKRKFIIAKAFVFIGILIMAYLAIRINGLSLPSYRAKFQVGAGISLVIAIVGFAYINRIRALFRIKSFSLLGIFLVLLLLRPAIDTLLWSLGLILIPLIIDDLIIIPYFKYLSLVKYRRKWYNEDVGG